MLEDTLSKKEVAELLLSKVVLVGLLLAALLGVVWFAWVKPGKQQAAINSFATCVAAGNPVQESYPEVCVTQDGRRFTNPSR